MIILFRMNIYSDPVVQLFDPVVVCSVCGEHGHSKRSCRYSKAEDLSNMSQEDRVFWSYVHPKDRPESLGGGEQQEESMDVNEASDEESGESDEEEDESGESDDEGSSLAAASDIEESE